MDKVIENIRNKELNIGDYHFAVDNNLSLLDNVLLYNSGSQWKIIPLNLALSYPIIYDKYAHEDQTYDITIILCPITLRCSIFKGIFEFETYHNYTMILKEKNLDVIIPISMGMRIDKQYIIHPNRRVEVQISTLKSALMFIPDTIFMISDKKIHPVIDIEYYSNLKDIDQNNLEGLIHPKTLVYIIQYKSFKSNEEKVSILLGKDASQNSVSGYDMKKSEIIKYLDKYNQKIINRGGFIIPMLWYTAKESYKLAKVVYII